MDQGAASSETSLNSIAQRRGFVRFEDAPGEQKFEICREWISAICDLLEEPRTIPEPLAKQIDGDLIQIVKSFKGAGFRSYKLNDLLEQMRPARVESQVALDKFAKEKVELDEDVRTEISREKYKVLFELQKYLNKALEYLEPLIAVRSQRVTYPTDQQIHTKGVSEKATRATEQSTLNETLRQESMTGFDPNEVDRRRLREVMIASNYDEEKLEILCNDLEFPYIDLKDKGIAVKLMRLIDEMRNKGRYAELVKRVIEEYPGLIEKLK